MKLITPELIKRFKEVGDQSEVENPLVIAKFFDPVGSATWYTTDYNPETDVCFGYVTGLAYDEWGTFSIDELESIKRPFKLRMGADELEAVMTIERDIHFQETPFKELMLKDRLTQLKESKSQEKSNQEIER